MHGPNATPSDSARLAVIESTVLDLKEAVSNLEKFLLRGNGRPSLVEQINTRISEESEKLDQRITDEVHEINTRIKPLEEWKWKIAAAGGALIIAIESISKFF